MSQTMALHARESDALPRWFDAAAPWMGSALFHLGVALLFLFASWFVITQTSLIHGPAPMIISDVFMEDAVPGGVPNPGEMNAPRDAGQEALARVLKSDGWAQRDGAGSNYGSVLTGANAASAAEAIFTGGISAPGGSVGATGEGGPIAPYGAPGGVGIGPASSFFGCGGSGVRIVYVVDHSGSLLDNFDFLRAEVKRSVDNLLPVQQFAVVAFAEDAQILGPPTLQRATNDAKHALDTQLDQLKGQGQNDDQLPPFQHALEKAFALKPQLIYFLTDGAFDPKLDAIVARLNANHKVRINTLAFVQSDPHYEAQLKALARNNGGTYKFVSERDLGR
jgi:hypothetical protein